jgi:hypothetical protein
MPKAEPNSGLLQEIVSQLRQLNKSSATDMLREAEALQRAEKLQATTQEGTDLSGIVVDDNKDFQRRFISAQASAILNEERRVEPGRKRAIAAGESTREIAKRDYVTQTNMYHLAQIAVKYARDTNELLEYYGGQAFVDVDSTNELLYSILSDTRNSRRHLLESKKFFKSMDESLTLLSDNATKKRSLYVHDLNVEESIGEVLTSDKKRNDELDRQRNTDLRAEEEARRERMKNLAGGAAGVGAGTSGGGEDGGFMDDIKTSLLGGATGGVIATVLLKMKAIWNFTKLKFLALGPALAKLGAKIFAPWKNSKSYAKFKPMIGKGPRMWGVVLAGLIAASFVDFSSDEIDGTNDTESGGAAGGGDPEVTFTDYMATSNVAKYGSVALNTAMAASLLKRLPIMNRAGDAMKAHVQKTWAKAPENSMKGRIWKRSGFARMLGAQAGRGALRMLGPWGMAAWAAWMIVDWQLEQAEEVRVAHEDALNELIASDDGSDIQDLVEQDFFTKYAHKVGGGKSGAIGKIKEEKKKDIKALFAGKSEENSLILRNALHGLGWTDKELNEILGISTPITDLTNTAKDSISNLSPDNFGRTGLNGVPLSVTNVGTVDSSVNQNISYHYFLKGREVSTWTGKPGGGIGGGAAF